MIGVECKIELPHQFNNDQENLHDCHTVPDANPRTATKGYVTKSMPGFDSGRFESAGVKNSRIWPDGLIAVSAECLLG